MGHMSQLKDLEAKCITVNPQKRPTGLILSLSVQMWVLLEFCQIFVFLPIVFQVFCGSYSRAGLFRGFTVNSFDFCTKQELFPEKCRNFNSVSNDIA